MNYLDLKIFNKFEKFEECVSKNIVSMRLLKTFDELFEGLNTIYLYRYHPIADIENVVRNGLTPYTQESMGKRAWDSGDAIKWGWDKAGLSPDDEVEDDQPRIFFTPIEWKREKGRVPLRVKKQDIEYEIHPDENLPPDVFLQGKDVEVQPELIEININNKWIPLLKASKNEIANLK